MQPQKHCHEDTSSSIEHVSNLNHDVVDQDLLIFCFCRIVVNIHRPLNAFKPSITHRNCDVVSDDKNIDQQKNEKFPVPEADTIVDPRTMMVHIKNTPIARRTVMASLWLENVTHQAITATLILWVTKMEAPKDWNLSWVSSHRLYE